jgi:hypothetical protein
MPCCPLDERTDKQHVFALLINLHHSLKMYSDDPEVSLAQALAEYLHLSVEEAEELTDAEVWSNESEGGLVYSYYYDFTHYASPRVARKIRARHGDLRVELPASFFDRVRTPIE